MSNNNIINSNLSIIKQFLEKFYNWLFPTKCILCNSTNVFIDGIFCSECFSKLTIVEEPICNKCGKLFTTGMPINSICNECSSKIDEIFNYKDSFDNSKYQDNSNICEEFKLNNTKTNVDNLESFNKYNNSIEYNKNNVIKDATRNGTNENNYSMSTNISKSNKLQSKEYYNTKNDNVNNNTNRLFEFARTLLLYDKFAKKIIMDIKVNADSNIANACCRLLFNKYPQLFENIDYIVPVPSHWSRILRRGFNPIDIIAKELSSISGIKVNRSLKRIRHTAYQHKKTKAERLVNLNKAFACNNNSLQNKNVLLIDDVFATGTTLNECTRALLQHGVKLVRCATIASTAADYYNYKE